MNLQTIRRLFEAPVETGVATVDSTIPVFVENQTYIDNDAVTAFVLVRVSFGAMTEPTFCGPAERIRGVVVVEIYTPKGEGPAMGQELAASIAQQLNAIPRRVNTTAHGTATGRINDMVGPNFTPLDGKPHFMTSLSCGFQASYT